MKHAVIKNMRDLEISSGAVEGAVNYVIAKRFDGSGMRWVKERAEHLLQLVALRLMAIGTHSSILFMTGHRSKHSNNARTFR